MTRSPETDHVCEPGGFYANICQACKADIANGFDPRFAPLTPGEATARRNREEASRVRGVLNAVGPMRVEDHYPVRPS